MKVLLLELKEVSFCPDDQVILEGINLVINEGDNIRVIGESGSGKSTLLKLIAGLTPISSGDMIYEGKNFNTIKSLEYRKQVSYVPQTPHLFGETIGDNLRFPAQVRDEAFNKERAEQLMQTFRLSHFNLDQSIHHLSGGEKQRVSLIRHLMYPPKLLLLDEITSALDEGMAATVWEWLITFAKKEQITLLWISHQSNTQIQPNKTLHVSNKKVTEEA